MNIIIGGKLLLLRKIEKLLKVKSIEIVMGGNYIMKEDSKERMRNYQIKI